MRSGEGNRICVKRSGLRKTIGAKAEVSPFYHELARLLKARADGTKALDLLAPLHTSLLRASTLSTGENKALLDELSG